MRIGLKLLMFLFWVVAISTTATAQSAEEDDAQTVFKKIFGGIEVSCETLLIAEYESVAFVEEGKPRIIAFDRAECERQLAGTQFSTYLQPLFDSLALMNAEPPLTEEEQAKETTSDQEQRTEKIDEQMALMQGDLQKNIKPLVSLCRELGEKHNGEHTRVCFLGAPKTSAGRPFQALFQAMVDNTQPSNEALCASNPISRGKSTASEFLGFLGSGEQTLSWAEVQQSLLKDKFECSGEGNFGGCRRHLIALAIGPQNTKEEDIYAGSFGPKDGAAIIPRELTVYHGDWRKIGPPSHCFSDGSGDCGPQIPQRGSKSGICLAKEDWHIGVRFVALLNRFDEDE